MLSWLAGLDSCWIVHFFYFFFSHSFFFSFHFPFRAPYSIIPFISPWLFFLNSLHRVPLHMESFLVYRQEHIHTCILPLISLTVFFLSSGIYFPSSIVLSCFFTQLLLSLICSTTTPNLHHWKVHRLSIIPRNKKVLIGLTIRQRSYHISNYQNNFQIYNKKRSNITHRQSLQAALQVGPAQSLSNQVNINKHR